MHLRLAKRLIEKGAIRAGSEIEALYEAQGHFGCVGGKLTGQFTVVGARVASDGNVLFLARGHKTATTLRIPCGDVLLVDGMAPSRLASSTNLTLRGEDIPEGKRRGRPPKRKLADG